MDRKSAPQQPPKPPPAPVRAHRDRTSRKHQDEQHSFPENEGLVRQKMREAGDVESPEGAEIEREREAAAQRGRVT